jgi:hypothetical protein
MLPIIGRGKFVQHMTFIGEIFGQIIILVISGTICSFLVWKLKRKKTDFGDFLNRYGEMLAYAGLLFIFLMMEIIQWWTS